ncbi:MAG: alpha-amylase family glycosyl hydrolase [Oligoflexus sp.]
MTHSFPEWVRDAVFYQIFPDRFAKSSRVPKPAGLEAWDSPPNLYGFKGGDLIGVSERLDYLQDLGITAIYLTPVFQSAANHRYHTHDYMQVDPILGGNAALRRLLDEAHSRSIKVLLDGVFNHASRSFFQFSHTLENGYYSPFVDWFHFNKDWLQSGAPLDPYGVVAHQRHGAGGQGSFHTYGYHAWWDLPALPKFNTQHQEVREFLWQVAEYWIDFGIDGWRLDVPNEIDDDEFWREFRRRVKNKNPQAYLVGEIWSDAHRWLQGDQFDGVMNYIFAKATLGFFIGENLYHEELRRCGYNDVHAIGAEEYARRLQDLVKAYPDSITHCQLNLLGSHDTPRVLTCGRGDHQAVKLCFLAMLMFPGAPCIYYGDEIGMAGGHDPDCRRSFDWDKNTWNHSVHSFFRDCIRLRQQYPVMRQGEFRIPYANDGVVVMQRQNSEDTVLAVLNASNHPKKITLPSLSKNLFDAFQSQGSALMPADGSCEVAARDCRLLVTHQR